MLGTIALALTACSEPTESAAPKSVGPDDVVLPDETADALALERMRDWRDLPVFTSDRFHRYSSYDRETGAPVPISLLANGNRDMNNFVCRSADAEIEAPLVGVQLDLEECPEAYVHGLVMARVDGPGRMERFQLTQLSLRNTVSDSELLRIYLDDAPEPFLQLPLAAVLDGSAGEIFAPPFGRGSTHHLAWYYPVSFAKRLIVAIDRVGPLDLVYYQIDVASNVEHVAPSKHRLPARDDVKLVLDTPAVSGSELSPVTTLALTSLESVTLPPLPGPQTLTELAVSVAKTDLAELPKITLKISWDGAATPAIELPLSLLYAAALAPPATSSLALAVEDQGERLRMSLRLPMPFSTSALLGFQSTASSDLSLGLSIRGEPGVPSSPFGRLHAESHTTVAPAPSTHHPVLSAKGPGRYVGTCAMLEGHGTPTGAFSSPLNFLEGDFRGMVDGAWDLRDTGTEDFFDSCFYFESGGFGSAFAQAWDAKSENGAGRASACRWNVLGTAIDYAASFELDLEIGPGDPSLLERYRTVGFVYR
ncbi:MAG: DUF2961 domain-containing protein [Myxococcales bacterium]|nr:DUF2961 domain-containing protein [Myxococcales bacterium]